MKKVIMIFMVLCLLVIQPIMVVAQDSDEVVHIISPEVGEAGKSILSNELFISIYTATDTPLFLTLQKRMPKFTFESKDELKDIELLELGDEANDVVTSDILQVLSKKDIVDGYREAKNQLDNAEILLDTAKMRANVVVKKVDEASDLYEADYVLTEDDMARMELLKSSTLDYQKAVHLYEEWQEKYDQLFIVDIIDKMPIEVDPDFPYFEYTIDTIDTGQYTLLIYSEDNEVIERLSFEIITEDSVVDKIKGSNNIFDTIIDRDVFE